MKFTVDKEVFENSITKLDTIIPNRDLNTFLSNILIVIKTDKVSLTASDLESTVEINFPATDTTEGSFITKAKKLSDISRNIITKTIHFNIEKNTNTDTNKNQFDPNNNEEHDENIESLVVNVKGDTKRSAIFKLTAYSSPNFPGIKKVVDKKSFTMSSELLREMIDKVLHAASQEDNRYIFNGLCFQSSNENQLTIIGTDGRRLAAISRNTNTSLNILTEQEYDVVVHSKAIKELQKILDLSSSIEIAIDNRDIHFIVGEAQLVSRLLDGKFPKYREIIPDTIFIDFHLDKKELLACINQVIIMSKPPVNSMKFTISKDHIVIKTNTPDIGEAEIQLDNIKVNNSVAGNDSYKDLQYPLEVDYNSSFLMDILKIITSDNIHMSINNPKNKPILIKDLTDQDFLGMVMPITNA